MSEQPPNLATNENQGLLKSAVVDPTIITARAAYMHSIYAIGTTAQTIADAQAAQRELATPVRTRKEAQFLPASEANPLPVSENPQIKARKAAFDSELSLLLEHAIVASIARAAINEIVSNASTESEKFPDILKTYDTLPIILHQIAQRRGYPPAHNQSMPPAGSPRKRVHKIMLNQLDSDMELQRLTATMYHLWIDQLEVDRHTAIQRFNEHCVKNNKKSFVSTIMKILTRKEKGGQSLDGPITLAQRQINRFHDTIVALIERLQIAPHVSLFEHLIALSKVAPAPTAPQPKK